MAAKGTRTAPDRPVATCWTRRGALALVLWTCAAGGWPGPVTAQGTSEPILLVSRKRLLHETSHARMLSRAEIELTAELQRRVDIIKAELTAEEQELARLRPELPREEFNRRVAAFDRRVRDERRISQRFATNVQNALRAERLKLVEAIDPLLEAMRAQKGSSVILNADQVLAANPANDITDEVIAQFDATVPPPVIPDLDRLAPKDSDGPAPDPTKQ